jgi:hypothetical protein
MQTQYCTSSQLIADSLEIAGLGAGNRGNRGNAATGGHVPFDCVAIVAIVFLLPLLPRTVADSLAWQSWQLFFCCPYCHALWLTAWRGNRGNCFSVALIATHCG